ncbi:MAG: response regulator transcription factor [Myxococcota bacterium]
MARVLLIDDDPTLIEVLSLAFVDAGHAVDAAADGHEGLARARAARPDVVVSDVNMPRVDGFTLCRRLREAGDRVPVVLLTSRDSEIDEALGLELGADDYVTKPFSTRVLLARVAALLRREAARGEPVREARRLGRLAVDADRLEVRWGEVPVEVTVTEFRLVEALCGRPGVVHSRDRLMELMRGDDSVVAERIVDTYVRRLRRKFERVDDTFDAIETVIGAGYRWRS